MKKQAPIILIVDDDEGHAILVRQNLEAAGLNNRRACDSRDFSKSWPLPLFYHTG